MAPMCWHCGEVFQWQLHSHWVLDFDSWCNVDMLTGKGFLRNAGRSLGKLKLPFAASFANSSALLLGAKSRCPGTHCTCSSVTPHFLALSQVPFLHAS